MATTAPRISHLIAATLCELAYFPAVDVAAVEQVMACPVEIEPVHVADLAALLVKTPGRHILVFRGTVFANRVSALRNLKIERVLEFGRYESHAGYAAGVDKLAKALEHYSELPLTVCGHSAGGAMAVLYAVRKWCYRDHVPFRIDQVITFGAPRVGDSELADIEKRLPDAGVEITRFANSNDLIPYVPFRRQGYRHGTGETYLDRFGNQHSAPWLAWKLWDWTRERVSTKTPFDHIRGHEIATYRQKLERTNG